MVDRLEHDLARFERRCSTGLCVDELCADLEQPGRRGVVIAIESIHVLQAEAIGGPGDKVVAGNEPMQTGKFCDQLMRQTVSERVVRKASARFLNGNTEIDGRCDNSMATAGFSVSSPGSTMLVSRAKRTSAIKRNPLP